MDIVLLGITLVSLVVALVMSAAAWRVARDERARSAARVAALTAAAASDIETPSPQAPIKVAAAEPAAERAAVQPSERLAVGESRASAPWASPRVSSFGAQTSARAASLRADASRSELIIRPLPLEEFPIEGEPTPFSESFLGSAARSSTSGGRQRNLAIAAIVLFGVTLAGGYWTLFGDQQRATQTPVAAVDTSPLELVSLRHERRGPQLAVTGLVRNPVAGGSVEKLTAVVFLFDQQGSFITSARANVDFLKLGPGDESPFVVSVEAPANVARYRVSFRNDAGVVPHVDRRGQEPVTPIVVSQQTAMSR